MNIGNVPLRRIGGEAVRSISPTDVSQFIRLDQCERYLRLRLYQRNVGGRFMTDYDVTPQSIPPILTKSGREFEEKVESAIVGRIPAMTMGGKKSVRTRGENDNARVIDYVRALLPGERYVLFQPRLEVALRQWQLRGDIDILHIECNADGTRRLLIVDMKSSTTAKVEHRLQVAFYAEMLDRLLTDAAVPHEPIEIGILYRGPANGEAPEDEMSDVEREEQRAHASQIFGVTNGYLEIVTDAESYRGAVHDLVTGDGSTAERVAERPFAEIPFHLTYKCDGCMFNEFCMKWTAERDDLSLLPYITLEDKSALQHAGVQTVRELAALKEPRPATSTTGKNGGLAPAPGHEDVVKTLASTWPIGPRLDELIVRARRYRQWKGDDIEFRGASLGGGYGSLPYCDEHHNPNLVRIYVDAQHDYLKDRIYMLGALVTGAEGGVVPPQRRRNVVRLAAGPPESVEIEHDLFLGWIDDVLQAIAEVAAPDAQGQPNAPIHLIFYNHFEQRLLLDGLARHFEAILTATPLYDFVTQLAAFDSPITTFLDEEIRQLKVFPFLNQSLQAVASHLKFGWAPFNETFRTRMFDYWGKFDEPPRDGENPWYTKRARFNSQIPLEYAYAAWHDLPSPPEKGRDEFRTYRDATPDLLTAFHARRLEALETITQNFPGNRQTEKRQFALPDLASFQGKAQTLAQALDEFVTLERHTELADWKSARLISPERRVLAGITLIGRYRPEEQDAGALDRNRENLRRRQLREEYESVQRMQTGESTLTKAQKAETRWDQNDLKVRLRLATDDLDLGLDQMLLLSNFRAGERVVVLPRTSVDSRLPKVEQVPFTPTPKMMLWGTRAEIEGIEHDRDAGVAWVDLRIVPSYGGAWSRGFVFGSIDRPFDEGELYTIDAEPNDWYGYFSSCVTTELCGGAHNTLYERLTDLPSAVVEWPSQAAAAQRRFLEGLDALLEAGEGHPFEESKRTYISACGDAPVLLVQGPPGTGKSYSSAFALFSRMQGAMAAGRDFRAALTCKTHAATDVLLTNVADVQAVLRGFATRRPDIFDLYFDRRLLGAPLFRFGEREGLPSCVRMLRQKRDRQEHEPEATDALGEQRWCMVGLTPGGSYRIAKDRWGKPLSGHDLFDCLVLDEASQMNLPEACMAALLLKDEGQVIVVGDHRQMPPIVKRDWGAEPRRTFKEFRAYESLFLSLLPLNPPAIKFEESFRLHADMAEFLRQEVYQQDGIPYFSRKRETLAHVRHGVEPLDPFVAAVLAPDHPIVVVMHDENRSLTRNSVEAALTAPVLETLSTAYDLGAEHGLGVVVPHRAQRALLAETVPSLTVRDSETGTVTRWAVDTVERFQGDERVAILVSATESDPQYLLVSSEFLLDPRRLNVALSRAKSKMVLVASRSVFTLFSANEETFAHAQFWKNLLHRTCTVRLWAGERAGTHVEVWGNVPGTAPPATAIVAGDQIPV